MRTAIRPTLDQVVIDADTRRLHDAAQSNQRPTLCHRLVPVLQHLRQSDGVNHIIDPQTVGDFEQFGDYGALALALLGWGEGRGVYNVRGAEVGGQAGELFGGHVDED